MNRIKPKENKIGYAFGILLAVCASVYMIFSIMEGWDKYSESDRRLQSSQQEIAELQKQYQNLEREKAHASSTTGIEMQMRSKFDLMKPEENAVFIISEEEDEPVEEKRGIDKIFNSFKKFFN